MHKLTERQLRKHFGSLEAVPPEVLAWVQDVDEAYRAADSDRLLVERSLELTSQELMQRNAALRSSEEEYRRIIETATEGIWVLGEDDCTKFVNERCAQMLGTTPREMIGKSVLHYLDGPSREEAKKYLERRRQGVREQHDMQFRRADGGEIWAIVSASPIIGRDGRYQGALKMLTDITDRKRAETEIRRAYERLKELDEFRTQFINNAAHELGTPLTPIKLQVHMLRNAYWKELEPAQQKATEILERNVERLAQLVGDILDVSKIQSGKLNLKFQRVQLAPMVRDASESFHAAALNKEITLEVAAEQDLECHVDPRRFGQIVYNLLTNAIKFTPAQGKINVVARRVGNNAQIVVKDSGRGISAEAIAKLFQPFSQVHDMMQLTAPGTGLGLFISRGIVEQMGGKIWCESPGIGKGTSFFVEFPLASYVAQNARVFGEAAQAGEGPDQQTAAA